MLLRGEWKHATTTTTSTTDDHIIALQAAVQALMEQQANRNTAPRNSSTRGKGKGTSGTSLNTGQWAWKDVAPKEGESLHKTVSGKDYVHCPNHATTKWVHASKHQDGCTLDADWKLPSKVNKVEKDDAKPKAAKKQLQYARAMLSLASKNNNDSGEDTEDKNI